MTAKTISREDMEHIKSLLKWSAEAAARGDQASSDRLYAAANRVMTRAHYDAIGAHS